jgi:hypothetical protein
MTDASQVATEGPGRDAFLAVDAHVHFHGCFDPARFIRSAFRNFRALDEGGTAGDVLRPVLLLAEALGQDWFGLLAETAFGAARGEGGAIGPFRAAPTAESISLAIHGEGGALLAVVAGRQIITKEGLEVLALATRALVLPDRTLQWTVAAVADLGAVPVIPWGFGKWTGRRGRILENFLAEGRGPALFLGDNGGRPDFLPVPRHFRIAAGRGIRILPGSDPLPFPSEESRPGSVGFTIRGPFDVMRPGRDIRRILLDPSARPVPYGRRERPIRFLRNQCAMQIRKLASRRATS